MYKHVYIQVFCKESQPKKSWREKIESTKFDDYVLHILYHRKSISCLVRKTECNLSPIFQVHEIENEFSQISTRKIIYFQAKSISGNRGILKKKLRENCVQLKICLWNIFWHRVYTVTKETVQSLSSDGTMHRGKILKRLET